MSEPFCPRCGLAKRDWKGNRGEGVRSGGQTYCCEACAQDTGCTCRPAGKDPTL